MEGYSKGMKKRLLPESPEEFREFVQNNVTEKEYKAAKMAFLEDMQTGCHNLANLSVPPPWRDTDKPRNWLYSEDFPNPEVFYTPLLGGRLGNKGRDLEKEKALAYFFLDELEKEDFVGQWLKEKEEGEEFDIVPEDARGVRRAGCSQTFDPCDSVDQEADEMFFNTIKDI